MSVQRFRFGRAVFDESIFSILFLSAISAGEPVFFPSQARKSWIFT